MTKRITMPDPAVIADIRAMVDAPKFWVSGPEMAWVDAGGRPRGFACRERLALEDGTMPAGLFVQCYFKPTHVPGNRDKLSIGLIYNGHRVYGIDDNGPSGHFNLVGIGRPHFGQRVGHPQVHTVSDDGIDVYAEPLPVATFDVYWVRFLLTTNIRNAPPFRLPTQQLGLPV